MKSLLFGCCLMIAGTSVTMAQDKSLREFRNNYRGKAEVHSISVGSIPLRFSAWVLKFGEAGDEDVKQARQLLRGVRKVKLHTIENPEGLHITNSDVEALKQKLQTKDHFETLMEVREKGNMIHVLNKGKDDELGHVVMLVQEENEFLMVNLQTNLKIEDINRLIRQFASN
ncbi:DUF4252 domain-containing protein [Chitinophaga sp. HK235]|uniref:DUF4252 domain-containing protein n=1 Tax=Chitinophaga sp. HK235 TaxID=2952571 RepID=UPI001BAC7E25|nr:DUF4252 domain-containing protein [Chitinophaga sp. HK235]